MRVLELFSGYGSQALALENLGIEFTSDISEIDTYAIKAYNQIHGDTHNWGDITKVDETKLPYYDLITYSSPCQDFSVAGLGRGGDEGSGTRSSLLWECERIIRAVKPKYLLMENVKNLVGKAHVHNFNRWLRTLEMMGYWNFWQVLNAKDYGVPQNRERVFVVSILGGGQYLFPNKIKLEKRLKDILEPQVDEKYYLSDKTIENFISKINLSENTCIGGMQANQSVKTDGVCTCLTSSMGTGGGYVPMVTEPLACASRGRNPENPSDRTVGAPTEQRLEINESGCSNTLTSVQKDNWVIEPLAYDEQNGYVRQDGCVGTLTTDGSSPKHNNRVIEPSRIKEATAKGYAEAYDGDSVTLDQPNSETRRGRVGRQISNTLTTACNIGVVQVGNIIETDSFGGNPQRGRIYSADGCPPALNTMQGGGLEPKILESYVEKQYKKFVGKNGYVPEFFNPYNCNEIEDVAPTLTAQGDSVTKSGTVLKSENYRIRKLTPRECWRLMGVKDEQYDKLHDISNTQLYKMAGNSIVVDVLMGIFKNLFLTDKGTSGQLTLF
jgi:DNA (cytosine-5)-methyltransferase 1